MSHSCWEDDYRCNDCPADFPQKSCPDFNKPPHPSDDPAWVREMEERDGTAFYRESLRQLAEYVRRI